MKFFHLSDLHIGLRLLNRDLLEDQQYVLKEVCRLAREEQPDAVLIAGDIYDKAVPSAEAVSLFDAFLSELRTAVPKAELMLISGNHDSGARVNLYRGLLTAEHVHMIGQPPMKPGEQIAKVTVQDAYGPVNFYLLPFVKPATVRTALTQKTEKADAAGMSERDNADRLSYENAFRRLLAREGVNLKERNVLVSHQFFLPAGKNAEDVERMDSEVQTVGNIDAISAELLKDFDYAALGHIHKRMTVGEDRLCYAGTPMACSVSEAGQQKGLLCVELAEKGRLAEIRFLPIQPLREVKILKGTLAEVLSQSCEDYVAVCLTDPAELDILDMQDRLRAAFPRLLEIRRELPGTAAADLREHGISMRAFSPIELCEAFMPSMTEEDRALLQDVINIVAENEE